MHSHAASDLMTSDLRMAGHVVDGPGRRRLPATPGADYFAAGFDAVERDLADKLRRLRASDPQPAEVPGRLADRHRLRLRRLLAGVGQPGLRRADRRCFLAAAPWYLLRRMAERHRQKIEDQLADAMVTLANAVRAGLSLAQSMEILAAQCPKPINAEFHQIVAEYNLGKPLERTLTEAKERLRSENFALFAAALLASHESGGRLNETVERIAQSVLELQRLERKVMAETAQARKSAVYMAMAPAFILVAYYFVDPGEHDAVVHHDCSARCCWPLAVVLNVVAYLWARVILNPDI